MSDDLLKKKCIPCEGGMEPLLKGEVLDYMAEIPGWTLSWDANPPASAELKALRAGKISKEYKFRDFIGAINFVERVADVAEMEGHHPDIHIRYNKVLLELSTHAISGLSENDFILAAKIDAHK